MLNGSWETNPMQTRRQLIPAEGRSIASTPNKIRLTLLFFDASCSDWKNAIKRGNMTTKSDEAKSKIDEAIMVHDQVDHGTIEHNDEVATTLDQKVDADTEGDDSDIQGNHAGSYPDAFFCPITNEIMENPVVASDGISYERDAIEEQGDVEKSKLYPNRALKEIMDERKEITGTSLRAGMMRMKHSIRKSVQYMVAKSILPSDEYRPVEEALYCPITLDLMHTPMIDPEGNTFEKAAILSWIRANENSPITRNTLTAEALYPNKALQSLLDDEKSKPQADHPTIRAWNGRKPPIYDDPEVGRSGSGSMPMTMEDFERLRESSQESNSNLCCVASLFAVAIMLFFYVPITSLIICFFTIVLWCGNK